MIFSISVFPKSKSPIASPIDIIILKEPYWCAIIAFALNTGAYTSEILRSAFQTIKPGIIEAGKSLGISNKIVFYKIQI